jgi:Fur family ferric uptake transcriptional regulator
MKSISNKRPVAETGRTAFSLAGTRATGQRALILEIIQQGRGHLDADEIYRQARAKQPRLSLSTVYRTLQTLKKLGLVEEVHIDDTHHHYEVKQAAEHHHLVCVGCGRVIEFHYPFARQIKKRVADAKDFDITDTEVRVSGYCSHCRRHREQSTAVRK